MESGVRNTSVGFGAKFPFEERKNPNPFSDISNQPSMMTGSPWGWG